MFVHGLIYTNAALMSTNIGMYVHCYPNVLCHPMLNNYRTVQHQMIGGGLNLSISSEQVRRGQQF